MKASDVRDRVLRQFGDEASVQVTETDILRWINDCLKEIALQNEISQAIGVSATIIGTNEYDFPADMLGLVKIFYNNRKLRYLDRNDYDNQVNTQDPDEVLAGNPEFYTRWANKFLVYPRPTAVGTLELFYIQRPAEITDIITELPSAKEYHLRVVDYCMRQAYEMDEDWDAAAAKSTQFDSGLSILKETEMSKDREYYPTITVLPEDM